MTETGLQTGTGNAIETGTGTGTGTTDTATATMAGIGTIDVGIMIDETDDGHAPGTVATATDATLLPLVLSRRIKQRRRHPSKTRK